MSVVISIEDNIDISRGNMIIKENNVPNISQEIDVLVTWFNKKPLEKNKKVLLKHTTNQTIAIINEIIYEIDVNTLHKKEKIKELKLNSIGRIKIKLANPIFFDSYKSNRHLGAVILIDISTNETLASGLIN